MAQEKRPADKSHLGEFEEIVLLSVLNLSENAYGVTIRQTVEEKAQRPTSIGAIYATLDRLEDKGFVSSRMGEATAERGGRAKKFFKVEGEGLHALSDAEQARIRLRTSLPSGLLGGGIA